MQAMTARAKFDEPADTSAPGLMTAIPRSEIEEILSSAEDPELRLEVMRVKGGGAPRRETTQLSVSWEREDLERLLQASEGRFVTLSVDPKSLRSALEEPDVEAHGVREKLLVLTVAAVTAAGASAGGAFAAEEVGTGGGGGAGSAIPSAYTNIETTRADLLAASSVEAAGVPAAMTAVETARAQLLAASSVEATDALPAALTAVETARAELLAASSAQSQDTLPAALTAVEEARAQLLSASSQATTDTLPAALTAIEDARAELMAAGSSPATTVTDDGGATFSAPSPEELAYGAAGVALAITAAAFAARSRRDRVTPA